MGTRVAVPAVGGRSPLLPQLVMPPCSPPPSQRPQSMTVPAKPAALRYVMARGLSSAASPLDSWVGLAAEPLHMFCGRCSLSLSLACWRAVTQQAYPLHSKPARVPTLAAAGFNHPQLVRYAASPDPARQRYLTDLLDRAEELGLRVLRTWAHFEGRYGWQGWKAAAGPMRSSCVPIPSRSACPGLAWDACSAAAPGCHVHACLLA